MWFTILFFIGGIGTEIGMLYIFKNVWEISTWPKAPGKIKQSKVIKELGQFKAHIEYEFLIDNIKYSSNSIKFTGTKKNNHEAATEIIKQYPVGKPVAVFHNPNDYHYSYLEGNLQSKHYITIISPLVILLIIWKGLMAILKERKKYDNQ